jgi:hypothetical protein
VRDELGPVVHAQATRRASVTGQLVQPVADVIGGGGASDVDGEAPSRELIDDVEQLHSAQVTRLVELKVHCPDYVESNGAHRTDYHIDAGQVLLLLAIGHFQALFASQALDFLVVHAPSGVA